MVEGSWAVTLLGRGFMFVTLIANLEDHVTLLGKLFGTIIGIKNTTFESSLFD